MDFRRKVAFGSALVIAFSLTACQLFGSYSAGSSAASSLSTSSKTYISVEEYASQGQIYGCKFKLRDSIESIKQAYHYGDDEYWNSLESSAADEANHDHDFNMDTLEVIEDTTVRMITGDTKFYYRSWLESEGVAFIAYFSDSFSYSVGSTDINEVRTSIDSTPIYDDTADSDNLFFIPGEPENVHQLKYEFGDYYISFFFENNALSATTIYYAPTWVDYETQAN